MSLDWSKYKNFSKHEFDCKHTGRNNMRPEFMDTLQQIRSTFGSPMVITSGYRDFTHPIEREKENPGEHYYGVAVDISTTGMKWLDLVVLAYGFGIHRIGINKEFIHLGMGDKDYTFPRTPWVY